ncbi:MAG: 4-hydroxythreonine-4-phosphate dehydrogenase PdxA [Tepidisphaera sp.]|nr:4-hydroxythreonine-4-phosphate dehydrogenase PdxA [Tepidisphaera sp.]
MMKPRIAISMGDPNGIGAEVIVKALGDAARRGRAAWVVVGSMACLERAAGVRLDWRRVGGAGEGNPPRVGEVVVVDDGRGGWGAGENAAAGEASFAWVQGAIDLARRGAGDAWRVDGVVTGPISKKAWELAGHGQYPGHTELFAERFGVREYAMMFVSPVMNVILATVHVPLARVADELSEERVLRAIVLGAKALEARGVVGPRVAVCGLNPHAGEGGLLGSEDSRLIAPAIEAARTAGVDASGPYPADTVFLQAMDGVRRGRRFDLVVAMYHDQGLGPFKLVARDSGVNVTVGLPTVRTSPDHGTAFDIAGKNVADAGSMGAAMDLAVEMAKGRDEVR